MGGTNSSTKGAPVSPYAEDAAVGIGGGFRIARRTAERGEGGYGRGVMAPRSC